MLLSFLKELFMQRTKATKIRHILRKGGFKVKAEESKVLGLEVILEQYISLHNAVHHLFWDNMSTWDDYLNEYANILPPELLKELSAITSDLKSVLDESFVDGTMGQLYTKVYKALEEAKKSK
jgi:hypothetical protein